MYRTAVVKNLSVQCAILIFFAAGFSAFAQSHGSEWKTWTPPGAKFKVELPGTPADAGDAHELRTARILYRVGFNRTDAQAPATNAYDMRHFWNGFVKNLEVGEGIKALEQSDFKCGTVFGREVTFEQGDLILLNRYLFSDGVFYVLITATRKQSNAEPGVKADRRRFLDSFVFLDNSETAASPKKP